jgi:hypothetical protein
MAASMATSLHATLLQILSPYMRRNPRHPNPKPLPSPRPPISASVTMYKLGFKP